MIPTFTTLPTLYNVTFNLQCYLHFITEPTFINQYYVIKQQNQVLKLNPFINV